MILAKLPKSGALAAMIDQLKLWATGPSSPDPLCWGAEENKLRTLMSLVLDQ